MSDTSSPSKAARYTLTKRVTWVGIISNLLLACLKTIFGWLGNSQALLADGIHSLSDLLSDAVVLVAAKYSALNADANHPYGHARFETIATVLVGVLLVFVAGGIFWDVIMRLLHPEALLIPTTSSLVIVIISIAIKEALYHYTRHAADKIDSKMLHANAWHHRSDAVSSIIVLVGILGTLAGLPWFDAVAAFFVSIMIVHIGGSIIWNGLKELVDTGLQESELAEIRSTIKSIDEVITVHGLRTRYMGSHIYMDVHLRVQPHVSVSEGHQIGEVVRNKIIHQHTKVADVIIHIDPENDELQPVSTLDLPLRTEITAYLHQQWHQYELAYPIKRIALHYLNNAVYLELYLSSITLSDNEFNQSLNKIKQHLNNELGIIHTTILYIDSH